MRCLAELPTGAFFTFGDRKGKVLQRDEGMSEVRWVGGQREILLWSEYPVAAFQKMV